MIRRPSMRGFTLVEILTSLAVASIVLGMMVAVVISQKGSLQGSELRRTMSEDGKDAILALERQLRAAGFGVDPRFAFDFSWYDCGSTVPGPGGRATCRDRQGAPDRLVFMARSPRYRIDVLNANGCTDVNGCPTGDAWRFKSSTLPQVKLTMRGGEVFTRGQVLLTVCPSAASWTMSTVATSTTVAAAGDFNLTVYPTVAGNPYFENDYTAACYASGATTFLVNRYEYFVQTYAGVPWLMLDRGLDLNGDGSDPWTARDAGDLLPIAPNVEDLQVAYVMNRIAGGAAPDTNGNFVTGDDAAISTPEEPDPAAQAPTYSSQDTATTRQTLHPANIQAVRVSIVIRSSQADASHPGQPGDALPLLENSTRVLTATERGSFRRYRLSAIVPARNLMSHGMFVF